VAASHPRTRERFLALYDIAQGTNATVVATRIGRHFQSVQNWVHAYNQRGPQALSFVRTGGRPPFVLASNRH
jgi:transposase